MVTVQIVGGANDGVVGEVQRYRDHVKMVNRRKRKKGRTILDWNKSLTYGAGNTERTLSLGSKKHQREFPIIDREISVVPKRVYSFHEAVGCVNCGVIYVGSLDEARVRTLLSTATVVVHVSKEEYKENSLGTCMAACEEVAI